MKYYFYRTTNLINGKYYQGVHHSKDPEKDSYFGSGPGIRAAVQKYGRENFRVDIIRDDFKNMEEAYEYEASVITLESLDPRRCYNQVPGGRGIRDGVISMHKGDLEIRVHNKLQEYYEGIGFIKGRPEKVCKKVSDIRKGKPSPQRGRVYLHRGYDREIRVVKENVAEYLEQGWQLGHSQASKDRTSKGRQGYIWITNGSVDLQIRKQSKLPEGFVLGRTPITEQTRELMREIHKGHVDSQETRERKRVVKLGRSWKLVNGKRVWSDKVVK